MSEPRSIVENILLHTIFDPKEYTGVGIPAHKFYHKFLQVRKDENDGVSFDETGIGHGRLILKKSWKIFTARQKKRPEKYREFAYISAEPRNFSLHPFVSKNILQKLGGTFFRIIPDGNDKTHTLICLPKGIVAKHDGNMPVMFSYKDEELCGRADIAGIYLELYQYFSNRKLTKEECAQEGYFADCCKRDFALECTDNCP